MRFPSIGLAATAMAILLGSTAMAQDPNRAEEVPAFQAREFLDKCPEQLRIVLWNVEHFVDAHDDPYVDFGLENKSTRKEEDFKAMAHAWRKLNADVLVLTECEGEAWTRAFVDTYLTDMKYPWVYGARTETWHQNVVYVSRVPMGAITTLKAKMSPVVGTDEIQNKLNNRITMAEFYCQEYRFSLIGVHLKAGREGRDYGARIGQIDEIHAMIARELKLDPEANIMVLGDFNFVPKDREMEHMTKNGLKSVFEEWGFPPTHPSEYPQRHIDQMLVNDKMLKEVVPGTASVAVVAERSALPRLSDHLPVVVTIRAKDQ